jgi:hypothetical protein
VRFSLVVLLLVGLAGQSLADEVRGKVVDGQTLQPIAGATIKGPDGATRSDERGRFVLDSRVDRIVVEYEAKGYTPGSETVIVRQGGTSGVLLLLFSLDFSSEVIEIKGSKQPPKREPPGKQEITREELMRIPGTRGDALQAVRSLPGVANFAAQGAGPGQIVIRGSAPEDSKITIDGIEIPLLYHFFGFQSVLPSEFIETIDFQPGGFGPEDGRATGGVIDVKSRVTDSKEVEGFAEISFVNLAGLVMGPISKKHNLYFAAAMRRSLIDAVLPLALPDDANLGFVTAPVYYDAQVRADWTPRYSDRVTFFGLMSSDELSLVNDEIVPNEPLATGNFDNKSGFWRAILSHHRETDHFESRVALSGGLTTLKLGIGDDRYFKADAVNGQLRSDLTWKPAKAIDFRAGIDMLYLSSDLKAKLPLPPQEGSGGVYNFSSAPVVENEGTEINHASSGYVGAEFHPFERTTISPGMRLDYFHRYHAAAWGPRLGIQHKISEPLTLRYAMGSYSRRARRNEAVTTSLGPETATQYVLGGDYHLAAGITAKANLFYTDRRSLIVQDPNLAQTMPEESYVNRGSGRSFGADMVLRAQTDDFFGWVAYTLSRSDRVDSPLGQRRLFDIDQTHILTLLGSYKWRGWQFGGRWQFSTGRPITPIEGSRYISDLNIYAPVLGKLNSDRFAPAHQLDIRVDRKFKFDSWKLEVYLDVTNVYLHPQVLGYRYNYDFSQQEPVTQLPIVPAVGVRGSF